MSNITPRMLGRAKYDLGIRNMLSRGKEGELKDVVAAARGGGDQKFCDLLLAMEQEFWEVTGKVYGKVLFGMRDADAVEAMKDGIQVALAALYGGVHSVRPSMKESTIRKVLMDEMEAGVRQFFSNERKYKADIRIDEILFAEDGNTQEGYISFRLYVEAGTPIKDKPTKRKKIGKLVFEMTLKALNEIDPNLTATELIDYIVSRPRDSKEIAMLREYIQKNLEAVGISL